MGDPIIDILRFVETSGKSNKSNVISTKYLNEENNPGGVLLVANFLNLLFKNINQKEDIFMLNETGHFPFYEDPDQLEKILMNILKVN